MRLLLVEDDSLLGDGLAAGLAHSGYQVEWIRDGTTADRVLRDSQFDVLVLDLGLPGCDGLTILKALRAVNSDLPVLILTARDTVEERIAGLDAGADDYVLKPFALDELTARLRAITRRRSGRSTPQISYGNITLDPASRVVTQDEQPIELTNREFVILELLFANVGKVQSRTRLEEALYGWDEGVESNALEVYIHHLRRKLGKKLIRTLRGVGYIVPANPEI